MKHTSGIINHPSILNISHTLPRHITKFYTPRLPGDIKILAIHHTGVHNGTPRTAANYHVLHKDWPGIGYHFHISKDGIISQTQNTLLKTNGIANFNKPCIHIACEGNFSKYRPSKEMINALIELCKILQNEFHIIDIIGHNQKTKTECPGLHMEPHLWQLKTTLLPTIYKTNLIR